MWRPWKTFCPPTKGLTTSGDRWSAGTTSRSGWCRRPASHCPPPRSIRAGWTTSIGGRAWLRRSGFCEPLVGWRTVTVRERRTKLDWAEEVAALLESRYPNGEKITLVLDNLNTHTRGALYEAFEAERARGLRQPHRVPVHSEARELAECRRVRIELPDTAVSEGSPDQGPGQVAGRGDGPVWRMSIAKARCRLKSVYPTVID